MPKMQSFKEMETTRQKKYARNQTTVEENAAIVVGEIHDKINKFWVQNRPLASGHYSKNHPQDNCTLKSRKWRGIFEADNCNLEIISTARSAVLTYLTSHPSLH